MITETREVECVLEDEALMGNGRLSDVGYSIEKISKQHRFSKNMIDHGDLFAFFYSQEVFGNDLPADIIMACKEAYTLWTDESGDRFERACEQFEVESRRITHTGAIPSSLRSGNSEKLLFKQFCYCGVLARYPDASKSQDWSWLDLLWTRIHAVQVSRLTAADIFTAAVLVRYTTGRALAPKQGPIQYGVQYGSQVSTPSSMPDWGEPGEIPRKLAKGAAENPWIILLAYFWKRQNYALLINSSSKTSVIHSSV